MTNDDPRPPEQEQAPDVAGELEQELTEEVADEEAALVAIRSELEQAWKLAGERLDQLKRLKADHENMKARLARERAELSDQVSASVSERLLPVLDDLERALGSARESGAELVAAGLELVVKQFHEALRSFGVEKMEAAGTTFDPRDHEALSSAPGDVEEPTVSDVIRPGYRFKDRTLRPAMVTVTLPAPGDEPSVGEEGA